MHLACPTLLSNIVTPYTTKLEVMMKAPVMCSISGWHASAHILVPTM
jgi:hypothetical protein